MIIVSNTSPLCYLALIGDVEVLHRLYTEVHTTANVVEELGHPVTPPAVRDWISHPPDWLRIHPDPAVPDESLLALHPGERSVLQLAMQLHSDMVLLDEAAARAVAGQRGLGVAGTLGVLCQAAEAGLLKLHPALDRLRQTTFRASPELWKALYTR